MSSGQSIPFRRQRPKDDVWRHERGAAAVEFGLIGFLLIWLIGVIIEVSFFLLVQFELESGVAQAGRQISMGTLTNTQATIDDVRKQICSRVRLIPKCSTSINIDVRNPGAAGTFAAIPMPSVLSVGPSTAGGTYASVLSIGGRGSPGTLIATYDWKFIFPMLKFLFGNVSTNPDIRRLYATSVYQIEYYP